MHIWLHTLLHEKHVYTSLLPSDWLSKTFSSTRLWILLAILKSSTNLWINLMKTSSETAIFSRMEPNATPRMREWPKSKVFWWPDYFESLMAAKISWLKSARFFPVERLNRKSLCQQATHHTGTGKQHSTWNCCDLWGRLAGHFRKHEASRSALSGQWWRTFPTSPLVSTCFSWNKVCSHICVFKI